MNIEYLLLNILILAGPMALSFEPRIRFASKWRRVLASILPPALLFIIWDSNVTNHHWFFNPSYTLDMRLLGLPIEEWMFFITVPYASLFVWENIQLYLLHRRVKWLAALRFLLLGALPLGLVLYGSGPEYTALALIAMGGCALLDRALHTDIFLDVRYYVFLAVTTILILLFNGYLTARPVVQYATQYQLDYRIITIPIEDFLYGYALLTAAVVLYEAWKKTENHG